MKYFEVRYNMFDSGTAETGPMGLEYDAFLMTAESEEAAEMLLLEQGEIQDFVLVETTEAEYNEYLAYQIQEAEMESFYRSMGYDVDKMNDPYFQEYGENV